MKKDDPATPADEQAAKDKFESDLLARGEAVPLDEEGKLPLAATHVIVPDEAGGNSRIERRRFKLL
jgi:hypothetical protein